MFVIPCGNLKRLLSKFLISINWKAVATNMADILEKKIFFFYILFVISTCIVKPVETLFPETSTVKLTHERASDNMSV